MKLINKKILLVQLIFGFLFLTFFCQRVLSKELQEDPHNGNLFIVVLHAKVVAIEKGHRVETVITLINLGNKPISLGRVDHKTGSLVGGDYELRMSVDISNAPLRYMLVGGRATVSNDTPFTSINLISGVTLMPGSALGIIVAARPTENMEEPEEGDAKFTFTLSGLFEGKIKTLIEMGFSMRYEKGKQPDDTRRLQASIKLDRLISNLEASNKSFVPGNLSVSH